MTEPLLSKEGQAIFDDILNKRPPIMRKSRNEKYLRSLSLLLKERGLKQADRELAIAAVKMVESRAIEPTYIMWDDPAKFKRLLVDPQRDKEAYFALPIQVKRWERPPVPPAKPAKEMKVLAFYGSPRKNGNTDILIDEAVRGVQNAGAAVEKFALCKMKINYCIGCRRCKDVDRPPFCAQKDDMTNIIYPRLAECDAIIVGFPVYSARENAQVSAFIDRWDCVGRFNPAKRAMVIGTWGLPTLDTYDYVIEYIMLYLNTHGVTPVEAVSACGFEGVLHGFDENRKAMILKYPNELKKAYEAGKGLVTT
jgi:multimeric flavodoxin WrbA